jgi:fatty-acyl-CoA synthase/8-demethylnovobiocic acid synthase
MRIFVAAALSPAHVPVDFSVWPELPRNDSGKPDLAFMRADAERRRKGSE